MLYKRKGLGLGWRLRCLPYFYIPGFSKSGTTDLYEAIFEHPDTVKPPLKEPIFWNRIRYKSKIIVRIKNVPLNHINE